MSWLLAVDPGLNNPAWALFKNGVLVKAQRTRIPSGLTRLGMGARCKKVAQLISADVDNILRGDSVDTLVTEWPQVYTATKSKGDPNDLLPLVGVGMYFAAEFDRAEIHTPTPREWLGGQIPKSTSGDPWASPRGSRIWSRLSDEERANIVVSHDALDAVGIGLWKLNRFQVRKVLAGINDQ